MSNIWIKKPYIEVELPRPLIQLRGRFKLVKTFANGASAVIADFSNIITDGGLQYIANNPYPTSYAYLGTGTATPAANDNNITAYVTHNGGNPVSTAITWVSTPTPLKRMTQSYRWSIGALNGNYSEIGLGWSSNPSGALWSRALILDGAQSPTTISVSSAEQLDAYYTVEDVIDTADTPFSITVTNVGTVDGFSRRLNANNANAHIAREGIIGSQNAGSVFYAALYTGVLGTYDAGTVVGGGIISNGSGNWVATGSLTKDWTVNFSTAGSGNVKSVYGYPASNPNGNFAFGYEFDTAISKTTDQTMSFSGRVTWGRV